MPFTNSRDGTPIYYESAGSGKPALLFVHGWIGNCRWWDGTRDAFAQDYQIVTLDLGGHGKSGKDRGEYSVRSYAEDIKAVADALKLEKIVLVGHSMSGSHVVEACALMPQRVARIIFVDTLANLEQPPNMEVMKPFFEAMRASYERTIPPTFRQYMFKPESPESAIQRVVCEALATPVERAIAMLKPFYTTDIRPAAMQVKVPVRAVQGDLEPTNEAGNRKYFRDYSFEKIPGVGHYPMFEKPEEFYAALRRALA
jgi:pimeloyl-ACP methyl ester carboxylesterase